MAGGGGGGEGEPEFQVAPMIDVLLVLLIFFMSITSSQVLKVDKNISLPVAAHGVKRDDKAAAGLINISWDKTTGQAKYKLDDRELDPNDKDGIAGFRTAWSLDGKDGGKDSTLFTELPRILALGGAYLAAPNKERWLCAPYVFTAWPADLDKFEYGAVITTGVLAKQAPTHDAPTVAQLAHEIVRVENWDLGDAHPAMTQRWVRIVLGGKPAFVPEEHVRSAVEHHACFAKRGGLWKLVQMRAGG